MNTWEKEFINDWEVLINDQPVYNFKMNLFNALKLRIDIRKEYRNQKYNQIKVRKYSNKHKSYVYATLTVTGKTKVFWYSNNIKKSYLFPYKPKL